MMEEALRRRSAESHPATPDPCAVVVNRAVAAIEKDHPMNNWVLVVEVTPSDWQALSVPGAMRHFPSVAMAQVKPGASRLEYRVPIAGSVVAIRARGGGLECRTFWEKG
jgi:hypothetical protein